MTRSSRRITVSTHRPSCAALSFGACDCTPQVRSEAYQRVCAQCGGPLEDRRRAYCSVSCKLDKRVAAKNLAERQSRTQEYLARAP